MSEDEGVKQRGGGHSTVRLDTHHDLQSKIAAAVRTAHRPCLVVLSGQHVGMRKVLSQTFLIGRDPNAGILLSDPGVSFHHARIEDRGDSWAVVDLESTNGTLVNGQRCQEAVLRPGDRITFGATVTRFEVQDALEQAFDAVVERLINIDELSGLYVRRKFDQELQILLGIARQKQQPLGLLVMDLDGIKAINDTHGHLFGAYVIGKAGHVIGEVLDHRGIASRFGGDEFVAALPDSNLTKTVAVGEEILAAIANYAFAYEGVPLRPGISVGVASFPSSARDAEHLFRRADEALYRAKLAGKNRVCT